VNEAGLVLLIKRTKEPWRGLWGFPGGHVDVGESPRQAIIREIKEETGLKVKVEQMLDIFFYPVLGHYHLSHLFKCRIVGTAKLNQSEKWRHEGTLKWCKPSQKNLNPVVEHALEKYLKDV